MPFMLVTFPQEFDLSCRSLSLVGSGQVDLHEVHSFLLQVA